MALKTDSIKLKLNEHAPEMHVSKRNICKDFGTVLLFVLQVFASTTLAQFYNVDPTFNSLDAGFGMGDGPDNQIYTTSLQTDGKIIIGGAFTNYNSIIKNRIARLNIDGSLDLTFNSGSGADDLVRTSAIQADGKIIIAGNFYHYNGTVRSSIARLNSDGSVDAAFNPGTGANSAIQTVSVQSDGKIVIGGYFTSFNGTARNYIARLNADGSVDMSFDPGSGASSIVQRVLAQGDGKVLIAGSFTTYNGTARNRIARLNSDGSLDTSFDPGSGANSVVETFHIQPDHKILIGGNFNTYNATTRNNICRLNTDGSLDTSFDPGAGGNNEVRTVLLQSDGKVIVGGPFTNFSGLSRNFVSRLNNDGTADVTFDPGTGASGLIVQSTGIQTDGKIIIGGSFTSYDGTVLNSLARLHTDGSLDQSFNTPTGANNIVYAVNPLADGKIAIAGGFTSFNNTPRKNVAILNSDGSLDTSFDPGVGSLGLVVAVAAQSDGKLIIAGSFISFNGIPRGCVARLNVDGTLDGSFSPPGLSAGSGITKVHIQLDGKIIVSGNFINYGGTARKYIARLNADGSIDTSFDPGTGTNAPISSSIVQPDGKVIVFGDFTAFNGTTRNNIARVNTNGSLDTSFDPMAGTGIGHPIYSAGLQTDGKIIIGGNFFSYNGVSRIQVARINSDGSLDTSFDPGSGLNNPVTAISVQADGKIIIGGSFTSYNGVTTNHIARLNQDGSLDLSFDPGSGTDKSVNSIAIQADGKILIGGAFLSHNGTGRNRVARLAMTLGTPTISNFSPTSGVIGTTVTINGTNFDPIPANNIVMFNGTAANVSASTSTSITTSVPAGATTGPISVTVGANTATSTSNFNVLQPPTISGFTPSSGPIGIAVVITGTNFDPTPSNNVVSFAGGTQATPTSGSTTSLTVNVPPGSMTGTISVTVGTNTASSTNIFTVTAAPVITINAQPTHVTACDGIIAQFSTNAIGTTNITYKWQYSPDGAAPFLDLNNGGGYSNVATNNLFVSTTGNFGAGFYRCKISGDFASTVFSSSSDLLINAIPSPPQVVSSNPVCSPASISLKVSGASNGQYVWYTVSSGGTAIPGEKNDTYVTPSLSVSTTYYVSINNGNCESSRTAITANIQTCHPPSIAPVVETAFIDGTVTIDLTTLLSDPDNNLDFSTLQVATQPESGAPAILSGKTLTIDYTGKPYAATDQFTIKICDLTNLCAAQPIAIEFTGDITVFNAMSPNDDGKNEIFFIQNIDLLPQTKRNHVSILNRWGDVVFETNDYDNLTRVFSGRNNSGANLPPGVYFYSITFDSGIPSRTGFISLRK